jgi:hypothetical protein
MHKRFILLAGILLISHGPAAAQISAPRIILAQEHVAPIMTMLPTVSIPLPTVSLLPRVPGKSTAQFNFSFAGVYERDSTLEHLSHMDEVKTLTLTQSSMPLVKLLGGRFQLNAFQNTLHLQGMQLGPFGNSAMRGSNYPGGRGSVHLTGLSLSFQFGRDAQRGHSAQLWRRLTGIVGAVLN